jgi:hypothetical protein
MRGEGIERKELPQRSVSGERIHLQRSLRELEKLARCSIPLLPRAEVP